MDQIMDAYALATKTLKSTRSALGLDSEKAQSIMEEWQQCMEEEADLATLITEPTSISEEEEKELESELNTLLEPKEKDEQGFDLQTLKESLPVAPSAKETAPTVPKVLEKEQR